MGCPSCGGVLREAIAPGYWQCTSIVIVERGGPGLVDSRLGSPVLSGQRICGVAYQEGSETGVECGCGTFAVGRCARCRRAVCGVHSSIRRDERLCAGCGAKEDEALARTQDAAASAADTEYVADRDQWAAAARIVLSGYPLPARVALVMQLAASPGWPAHSSKVSVRNDLLSQLIPELGITQDTDHYPWDDNEIASWFANACNKPSTRVSVGERRTLMGGYKSLYVDGWVFTSGSTVIWEHNAESRWLLACGVSTDGRRLYAAKGMGARVALEPEFRHDRYNGLTLAKMAEMTGLRPLDPEPVRPG